MLAAALPRLGGDLVHQRLDGVTAELAGLRAFCSSAVFLPVTCSSSCHTGTPRSISCRISSPCSFCLAPGLAEGQGDTLPPPQTAAQFERLIDDALHGEPFMGSMPKALRRTKTWVTSSSCKRGVLGEVLDPGGRPALPPAIAHHRLELDAEGVRPDRRFGTWPSVGW